MSDFKYEVAFSFLAQDEPLALELESLISDRLTTFVYSKRQEQVAGTDGEKTFADVFGTDARTVVVLFRKDWGSTPWTRIEETAIRNRAYTEGYDFALFIPLDKSPLPVWLPKARIWIGLERWGIQQAAGVIEMRVTERGGSVREEDALQQAERLSRQVDLERTKEGFLESDAGVKAAREQLSLLFELLERNSAEISKRAPLFAFSATRLVDRMIVTCSGIRLLVAWSLQYANSLKYSHLSINLGRADERGEPLRRSEFHFDRMSNGALGWRLSDGDRRFFETPALVDYYLKTLMNNVPGLQEYLKGAGR